jgi:tetratricopeptide (TPR) repeat protein
VQQLFRFTPGSRYHDLAAGAVERALTLDSSLAEAYFARADLAFTPEAGWRVDQAIADCLHAISLKPGLAQVHGALGGVLLHLGLPREGLRELQRAVSLDTSDVFSLQRIGRAFWYAQRYDSALAAYQQRNFGPEPALVLAHLGREREGLAMVDSIPVARGVRDVSGDQASVKAVLYARLGERQQALAEARRAETSAGAGLAHFHHAQFNIAMAYALLGEREKSVRLLQAVAESGMPAYELFANEPYLASLRGFPPYEQFMQRQRAAWEARRGVLARAGITP